MPKLSVVIPTFNRCKQVKRAVDSVLAQTRPPDQIIVVDDGSTDETSNFIKSEFGSEILLIRQSNKGVSAARNAGIRKAGGDLVAFLDSDDVWAPEKLEWQLPLMEDDNIVLSATNWKYETKENDLAFDSLDFQENIIELDKPLQLLSRFEGHKVFLSTWIVRKKALERVGCFDERMRVAEDSRALYRLAFEGGFALSTKVGVMRSSAIDNTQLTRIGDRRYQAEIALLASELLSETYIRASAEPMDIQKRVGQLLAYFLRRQAQFACMDGRYQFARRKAKEALALSPRTRDTMISSLILAMPSLVGRRERQKYSGVDDN